MVSSTALAVARSITRVSRGWNAASPLRSCAMMDSISAMWFVRAVTMNRAFLASVMICASAGSLASRPFIRPW